jgi:hypothetical protein
MIRIVVVGLLACWPAFAFVAPSAAEEIPSSAPAPAPSDSSAALIRVFLEDGSVLAARSVKSASMDMAAVVLLDSSIRYIPAARVRRMVDIDGRDITAAVLDRRESISTTDRWPRIPGLAWRGRPYPGTRSFMITELGVMYRMDRYPYSRFPSRTAVTFDLGWMKNVGTRHAVGFSGYAMPADQTTRLGIRGRYRRWLSPRLSVDVSPGVILGGEDGGTNYDAPGAVLGVTLNSGDLVAVMVDTELARSWEYATEDPPFTTRVNHTDFTWRAGAKIGSGLGLVGSLVLVGLGVAILVSGAAE